MMKKKNVICIILILIFLISGWGAGQNVYGTTNRTPFPELGAEAAVVIDASTGKLLFEQNKDERMFPASTTKLMTALLTAENLNLEGDVVIDLATEQVGEASIDLKAGEIITVGDLLKSLLIVSANDSAVALAKAVAGDVPAFAELMNERAVSVGALNTHFANPNGLHDDNHYTTAYDLALIAKKALEIPVIREIVGKDRDVIPATNLSGERKLKSTNKLLSDDTYKYEGATGMKTGYTGEAGNCLVASAKRGKTELIAVVLKSSAAGRFADCTVLLDYGFANYKTYKPMKKGQVLGTIKVKRGEAREVKIAAEDDVAITLPVSASEDIVTTKLVADKKITAPIKRGQKIGVVEIYQVGELMSSVNAVAMEDVAEGGVLSVIGISDEIVRKLIWILIPIALIFLVLLVIYIAVKRREVRKKRERRLERELNKKSPQEEAWNTWLIDYENRRRPLDRKR